MAGAVADRTSSAEGAARLVRRYLPLALLLAVAAHQMWRVEVDGLTRWRGGGFGMYSSVHFEEHVIWMGYESPDGLQFGPLGTPRSIEGRVLAPRCLIFPTPESLAELHGELSDRIRILQVWRPRIDPETLAYDRELLAEFRQ